MKSAYEPYSRIGGSVSPDGDALVATVRHVLGLDLPAGDGRANETEGIS
jgi:hypothetical protein